jgi:hypothetical protein
MHKSIPEDGGSTASETSVSIHLTIRCNKPEDDDIDDDDFYGIPNWWAQTPLRTWIFVGNFIWSAALCK